MPLLKLATTGDISGLENNLAANAALAALATACESSSEPTTAGTGLATLAGLLWHDTNTNTIKVRDQADVGWIVLIRLNETGRLVSGSRPDPTWTHKSADYTAVAGDAGKSFWMDSAGHTLTLPAPSTCQGAEFTIGGAAVTVSTPSGVFEPYAGSVTSLTLGDQERLTVISTGTAWRILSSSPRVGGAVMSVVGQHGDVTAAQIAAAISLAAYATLASPALTGSPTAPTAGPGTNSTVIATTAFVAAAVAAAVASLLSSAAFTGSPTAPTPATADNSTKLATTAWVRDLLTSLGMGGAGGESGG